jgi:hypothetical protein
MEAGEQAVAQSHAEWGIQQRSQTRKMELQRTKSSTEKGEITDTTNIYATTKEADTNYPAHCHGEMVIGLQSRVFLAKGNQRGKKQSR